MGTSKRAKPVVARPRAKGAATKPVKAPKKPTTKPPQAAQPPKVEDLAEKFVSAVEAQDNDQLDNMAEIERLFLLALREVGGKEWIVAQYRNPRMAITVLNILGRIAAARRAEAGPSGVWSGNVIINTGVQRAEGA